MNTLNLVAVVVEFFLYLGIIIGCELSLIGGLFMAVNGHQSFSLNDKFYKLLAASKVPKITVRSAHDSTIRKLLALGCQVEKR